MRPRDGQEPASPLQVGVAPRDRGSGRKQAADQRPRTACFLAALRLTSHLDHGRVAAEFAERAARHREGHKVGVHSVIHRFQRDRALHAEFALHEREDRIDEIRESELLRFRAEPRPVRVRTEVPEKQSNVQIHADARAGGSADVLGDVHEQIEQMEFRPKLIRAAGAQDRVIPCMREITVPVRVLREILLQKLRVDLVELRVAHICENGLPVDFDLKALRLHERVAPLPILRPNQKIDIAEGAQLRDRVVIAHDAALDEQMVDPLRRQLSAQAGQRFRPAGKPRHRLQADAAQQLRVRRTVLVRPAHDGMAENARDRVHVCQQLQRRPTARKRTRVLLLHEAAQDFQQIGRCVIQGKTPPDSPE